MAQKVEEKNSQEENKFHWFLMVVAIPSLFAVVIALVALSILGINIFETAKDIGGKVPFISQYVSEENQPSTEEFEKNIISLEAEIKDREAKMEQLQSKIDWKKHSCRHK